jgi:uncharacterized protein
MTETHMSWLCFTPDHVYKVKKPVVFGFVDLSRRPARERACQAEVEFNSRLSPDVYDGVGAFQYPDGRCEPVVVMKRLPEDRSLSALVRGGQDDLFHHITKVAAVMASFHRRARRGRQIDMACTASAVGVLWQRNMAELTQVAKGIVDAAPLDEVAALAARYVTGRDTLFGQRIQAGRAVDGHGDLLCDDVFCLTDGPRILDCLEYSDGLRYVDTLSDIASLAMDLERMDRPDLASAFLDSYRRLSGDEWPESLAHFYMAYRATVRAKVACIRARSVHGPGSEGSELEARHLVDLATRHLQESVVHLILVGGLPGTGKSTLAHQIHAATDWPVLSSDLLRKQLAGLEPEEDAATAFGTGIYCPEMTATVYFALLQEAETLLTRGYSVVLDASWLHEDWRKAAYELAYRTSAEATGIRCETSRAMASSRLRERREHRSGSSDATPSIAEAMATASEPWTDATVVDTSGSLNSSVASALRAIRRA